MSTTEVRVDPARAVRALSQARGRILVASLAVGAVAALLLLALPDRYVSTASFIPQEDRGALGQISGLAQQFGLALPADGAIRPPGFYAELIRSRAVLLPVARGAVADGIPPPELAERLGVTRQTPHETEAALVEALENAVTVQVDRPSGLLRLEVETGSAELSSALARQVLTAVDTFDVAVRRANARAERSFAEGRLRELRAELDSAETRLQTFLRENRQFSNAPALVFEHDRLQRDVGMRQEIVTAVAQSYEQARIEEVRNTPMITVVEPPDTPTDPAGPSLPLGLLVGMMLGGAAMTIFVLAREYQDVLGRASAGGRTP